ncbi:MAG TPA: Asp-tRNA(Asn)/Glu-tRNA(Gln) amidotransferase subunit GatB [Dehalococcoidia bacterium]|nr:Asp-tRNA(Asn)/Glu-tRNA(Gln) amidotransferase subunit GatB [Dehalococcoidia bacterium]
MTTTAALYETVIGLEVHAQLMTRSKMFCACPVPSLESPPNTHVCPVCLGMPGVLPVANKEAVELTIMTGLALNCEIPPEAKFDRKNYHYPDLMKGYQISEYDMPLCKNGWLDIEVEGATKRIGITRVHLEEDTARSLHVTDSAGESYSLIEVNRAGMPLMEIVSEPDLRSAEEARAYLQKLRQILRYIGASRANMEEGNMRCEPNVSIRRPGSAEFGQKVELKNINSFKHAYDAIKYEEKRQAEVLDSGGRVVQETRGWREDTNQSVSQRTKEYADDYRYFPEPDLPTLVIDQDWLHQIRQRLPELPAAKHVRFVEQYGLSDYDIRILVESRPRADFFETTVSLGGGAPRAKTVANWMNGEFARLLNASNLEIEESRVTPEALSQLIDLIEDETISGKTAKDVFEEMFKTGNAPKAIVETAGLTQISSGDAISEAVDRVIQANPKPVEDFRGGKEEAIKFLVGQVMRETKGRARPDLATEILREKLRKGP